MSVTDAQSTRLAKGYNEKGEMQSYPQDMLLGAGALRSTVADLLLTSTRDTLLSGTVTPHRAFLQAGNSAELVVFEGLPHGFWMHRIPEAFEAHHLMANFFEKQLEH